MNSIQDITQFPIETQELIEAYFPDGDMEITEEEFEEFCEELWDLYGESESVQEVLNVLWYT